MLPKSAGKTVTLKYEHQTSTQQNDFRQKRHTRCFRCYFAYNKKQTNFALSTKINF